MFNIGFSELIVIFALTAALIVGVGLLARWIGRR